MTDSLEATCQDDFAKKKALRDKEAAYYPQKMQDCGLKSIDRFVAYHPLPSRHMCRGITFAHRDLEVIATAMAEHTPWAVISGLNPSGPLHLGHKAVFDELLWMQQQGAQIFIPITNDESFVVGKCKTLAESRRIAYESVIPSIIAMGFEAGKTHIYVDSDYPDIYNIAMDLGDKMTLRRSFGVFGFEQDENPGTLFYRCCVQVGQILLPQYEEFGGIKPTLVPVGIDQHPYILLARDVAEKKGFTPPAELDLKFMLGLDGQGKMSASRPDSAIFLTDNPNDARRKLKTAYTGGSPLRSFQEVHGGVPQICPVASCASYHFDKDDARAQGCLSGTILCGQCKKDVIEQTLEYLADHQRKLPAARAQMADYLLKTPIRSIFNGK